ncbi:Uncharacterised protein [Acinetobacter baumannii]|nr:Uncharacterised protein [Acinetobacter baumannii]
MPIMGAILLISEPCNLLKSKIAAPIAETARPVAIPCKPRAINNIETSDANKKKLIEIICREIAAMMTGRRPI